MNPEAKSQLRANRRHTLNGWLATQNAVMDEAPFWPQALADAEAVEFARLDAIYDAAKAQLQSDLEAMSPAALAAWFQLVWWTPVGVTPAEQITHYMENG